MSWDKFKLYLKPGDSEGTSGAVITIGSSMSVSITVILGMCEMSENINSEVVKNANSFY